MNWNARKYFDDETRKKLQETIKDEALLRQVESAYESDMNESERHEIETQEVYARVAGLLAATSEISGISQERLLTITRRIAASDRDAKWYHVLSAIYSFYRINASLENEEE